MPEVLADEDARPPGAGRRGRAERRPKARKRLPGRQVAGLVEEAVGGQVHLAVDVDDLARRRDRRRRCGSGGRRSPGCSPPRRRRPSGRGERGQLGAAQAHGAVGDQVLEEVAGEGQLGEDHQVGAPPGRCRAARGVAPGWPARRRGAAPSAPRATTMSVRGPAAGASARRRPEPVGCLGGRARRFTMGDSPPSARAADEVGDPGATPTPARGPPRPAAAPPGSAARSRGSGAASRR